MNETKETQAISLEGCAPRPYLVQGSPQPPSVVAIGYARCSTEEQSLESMAIDYQVRRLEEVCGVGNVVRDEKSATKCPLLKRGRFWEAIERLRALPPGVEKRLIYTRVDRIARLTADGDTITDLCKEGIVFQGLDSGEVMQGAQGTMMLNMALMLAQYEQQLLGEKQEAKYRDRRKSKSAINRPPFGYTLKKFRSGDGIRFRWVPDEIQFIQAKQLIQTFLKNEGSYNETLNECKFEGMPRTARGLRMWLTNIALLGHTKYNALQTRSGKNIEEQIIENTHKPLVDQDTFNKIKIIINEKLEKAPNNSRKRPPHPLRSVLRCPDCGRIITFSTREYKCKGSNIGRYAGKREAGQSVVAYAASCRYKSVGECNLDTKTGCLNNQNLLDLKNEAWRYLVARADEISQMEAPDHDSLSTEELELLAGIKALEAIPGKTMKPQIEAMKAQLDQYKFKRDGKINAANTKIKELKRLNLSERAFNELDFEEQNELLTFFFHRIVPAYRNEPAVFDAVF